jgi:hypothetical protein
MMHVARARARGGGGGGAGQPLCNAGKTGCLRLFARCLVLQYRTPSGPSPEVEVVAAGCRGTVMGCFMYSRYPYLDLLLPVPRTKY